jgi:hypothetical protein
VRLHVLADDRAIQIQLEVLHVQVFRLVDGLQKPQNVVPPELRPENRESSNPGPTNAFATSLTKTKDFGISICAYHKSVPRA